MQYVSKMQSSNRPGRIVLIATSLVSMVLGSIHTFSVFLVPLEALFGASRSTVTLVYSFGLVCLTAAVLFGPVIYTRVRPATIYVLVAMLGAIGLGIAGTADSIGIVWIGYSLVFGVANGLGYGFGLQFAARANPDQVGLAMGVVTAAYALGSVLAPYGFVLALETGGFPAAMIALGITVFMVGIGAAILIARTGLSYHTPTKEGTPTGLLQGRLVMIWIAYGSGVAAGLMAIGHAAGIASSSGFSGWIAAAVLAACNLVGSFFCGWISDRISHQRILIFLPIFGAVALLGMAIMPIQTMLFLAVIGFVYGGMIATYPVVIAKIFPGEDGPRAYGRVFTAWGAAGLLAPWLAGQIYDWSGEYIAALWLAAGLAVVSAITAQKFMQRV